MGRVAGKVALVTGAGRGQGRSHALRLAAEGADVVAIDVERLPDTVEYGQPAAGDLDETVRLVREHGRRALGIVADVRDAEALTAAVLFLASDEARFVTGASLPVDLGAAVR